MKINGTKKYTKVNGITDWTVINSVNPNGDFGYSLGGVSAYTVNGYGISTTYEGGSYAVIEPA